MHPMWLVLGLLLMTGLAVRVAVGRYRRLRMLCRLAAEHRFRFSGDDLIDIHDRYQNLEMIRQGHNRHVSNVLYGPTDAGLATVFCYDYELGFGSRRATRSWWIAVVETDRARDHWWAVSADDSIWTPGDTDSACSARVGGFEIHANHEATLNELRRLGLDRMFQTAPSDCRWEIRGPLVAVAVPFRPDGEAPAQVLSAARTLSAALRA